MEIEKIMKEMKEYIMVDEIHGVLDSWYDLWFELNKKGLVENLD